MEMKIRTRIREKIEKSLSTNIGEYQKIGGIVIASSIGQTNWGENLFRKNVKLLGKTTKVKKLVKSYSINREDLISMYNVH